MEKKPQRTAQRIAIYDYVKDNKSHPSVKDIYQHVSEKLSSISITTVYNTMELLKQRGHVVELPVVIHGEGRRFDSNLTPHDHLICTSCGAVFDIEIDVDHSLLFTEKQHQGFDIKAISINVYGVCSQCKDKDSKILN
jgi:Fur family transcriptional regulator, peroxide stress response regulator